jgi:uncharacterized protein YbjT (DUF2867 family)
MESNTNDLMLVLGGTGKTGRRVTERLKARNVPVRVGSRNGQPPFEWKDRDTWGPALEGVTAVYITYYPDLTVPGAVEDVAALSAAAVAAGVQRLVLLSGRGEPEAEEAEEVVKASGAPSWTILRCSWFAQNFSEDYMAEGVRAGEMALPAGDVPEPFSDAEDIADIAVAALTEDGHAGRLYEITGPRALTFAEAMAEISAATGRDVAFVRVPLEGYAAASREQGVPGEIVDVVTYLFGTVLDGRNAQPADGVRQALGREPRDFTEFARDTAATGVWEGSAS